MTTHYSAKALVFKKTDRQEADRIFSVFTEEFGRLEVTARAIRKITSKLKGGIELFCVSDIEFIQGKNRKTLTDATARQRFGSIAENPEKLAIACQAADLTDSFIKLQEPDIALWRLMVDFFEKLDAGLPLNNWQLAYDYFFWNFVGTLGYRPELFKCVMCGQKLNPEALYFSPTQGGIVCQPCQGAAKDAKKIHQDAVKVLRLMARGDWPTVVKLKLSPIFLTSLRDIYTNYHAYLAHE